jgi:hypothetical protein
MVRKKFAAAVRKSQLPTLKSRDEYKVGDLNESPVHGSPDGEALLLARRYLKNGGYYQHGGDGII